MIRHPVTSWVFWLRIRFAGGMVAWLVVLLLQSSSLLQAQVPQTQPAKLDEDPFVNAVAIVQAAVAAVGTYDAKDTPTIRYFGTGFVVGNGRTIATNAHVVQAIREAGKLDQMRVFFPDPERLEGRRSIEGRSANVQTEDRFHDVALLNFDGRAEAPLTLSEQPPLQGRAVGVVGYPIGTILGLVPAAHKGVVAAVVPAVLPLPKGAQLTPELAMAIRNPYNLYQLDMVIFPGNSGSPLFDARDGKVIGIINKVLAGRTREHLLDKPTGVAYAVPVRWIQTLLDRSAVNNPSPSQPGGSTADPSRR